MTKLFPDAEKRFEVFANNSLEPIWFDTFKEADHFARLNAGTVTDTLTWEVLTDYKEYYD